MDAGFDICDTKILHPAEYSEDTCYFVRGAQLELIYTVILHYLQILLSTLKLYATVFAP